MTPEVDTVISTGEETVLLTTTVVGARAPTETETGARALMTRELGVRAHMTKKTMGTTKRNLPPCLNVIIAKQSDHFTHFAQ